MEAMDGQLRDEISQTRPGRRTKVKCQEDARGGEMTAVSRRWESATGQDQGAALSVWSLPFWRVSTSGSTHPLSTPLATQKTFHLAECLPHEVAKDGGLKVGVAFHMQDAERTNAQAETTNSVCGKAPE